MEKLFTLSNTLMSMLPLIVKSNQVKVPWVNSHIPAASPNADMYLHLKEFGYKCLRQFWSKQPKGPTLHAHLQLK